MSKVRIIRIRPVSWRVYVQGRDEAEYVQRLLANMHIHTSPIEAEQFLTEQPVYSIMATPDQNVPLTPEELESILLGDRHVELAFDVVS